MHIQSSESFQTPVLDDEPGAPLVVEAEGVAALSGDLDALARAQAVSDWKHSPNAEMHPGVRALYAMAVAGDVEGLARYARVYAFEAMACEREFWEPESAREEECSS